MTQEEITILQAICQSDYKAYLPQGSSVAAFREFDGLVPTLAEMKKAGWIELEVEKAGKAVKGYKQKLRDAAAWYETRLGGAQDVGGEVGGSGPDPGRRHTLFAQGVARPQ